MKAARILPALLLAFAATACTEKPQTISSGSGSGNDTPAYMGANNPFVAPGWKPGDKVSWEQHMRVRTQRGQNEYNKVN